MIIKKSINLVEIIIDEIALEGLDGITLEALWQRLAMRLGDCLPLKNAFMEQVWKICLELHDLTFFELENPRETLVIFDRYELEYMSSDIEKEYDQRDIYPHCPVEDIKLGIKGSCSTYNSRKDISEVVKSLTVYEADEKYKQKLVIVAGQNLRENALIDDTVSPIIQLSLPHYCLLERIGRTRRIGEISIKKSAHIKEDAKTLFYMRKVLLEQGLIRKQVYYQGNTGTAYNGQNTGTLIHLTRFYNMRKPKVIMWADHLINYLKSKENYAAEYNEVKNELNLDYSIKKFFKIQMLQKVFRTDLKVPYRSYYPNSSEKEWQIKNNVTKERIIKLVTLTDPNIEISDIWRTEEFKEDYDFCQLDISSHKLNIPFLKQIYNTVESKEIKGISQTELAMEIGFPKLISRTLLRNLDKSKIVSTYLDDIGRQRTKKYVSKKFESQSLIKKQLEKEINKIKKHRHLIQTKKIKENLIDDTGESNIVKNNKEVAQEITTSIYRQSNLLKNTYSNCNKKSHKNQLIATANHLLWKYKISKTKNRYKYISSTNIEKPSELENLKNGECNKDVTNVSMHESKDIDKTSQPGKGIHNSDFYKMIETELIVQKPECKKKSQKMAVVGFMKDVQNPDNMQSNVSYRLIRRANLILDSVKEHKIIEDTQKLMKYINKEEDKEGLDARMDKNSLIRLLQKLSEDNLIKYIKLVLKNKKHTKQKIVNFICDPTVKEDDTVIQSAIEQAKLKFCMMETNVLNSIDNGDKKLASDRDSSTKKSGGKYIIYRNDSLGKKYGYCPKFIRIKTMHIFLYYLIYDHPRKQESKTQFFENLRVEGYFSDDLLDSDIDVYSTDINWKTFVPPLPKHRGYPKGWALIRDILLRMPLSIFVKVHNVNFEVPGLQEHLDHPVKKHFLLRDIPSPIRNLLFLKRKYMFSVHELVTRLCFLGLVQFGPQMLKEKDQVFIYLNRNTEILDTTSSAAGYHKIEDKPYPMTRFYFTTTSDVEKYWYEMWNTCINTDLGGRNVVEGKDILLEDLSRKTEMIEATRVKTVEEAEKDDTGFVPGDRKGAAGIDSAFFSHLKRNWNWVNAVQQSKAGKKSNWPAQTVNVAKANTKVRVSHPRKLPQARKRSSSIKQNQGKNTDLLKPMEKTSIKAKRHVLVNLPFIQSSKPTKVVRKVLPRKRALRKRVKYDEIDFSALQRMDKLRVDWEQHEDNILLVCKVAIVYLCPNPRRNPVTFTAIRDVLRSYSFTSYNKTSRACQRRLLYMLKQPKTVNSVLLGVEEIKQDYYVNKRFGGLNEKLRNDSENVIEYEKKVEKVFKDLVTYIAKKYYNLSDMEHREPVVLPKTIQEFNIFYKLKLPTKMISSPGVSKEVRDITDIHTATINSVIHSSMCCGKERRSWAYQLFRVYQQYPEYLLRSAMLKIRADQMVTMKKSYMCAYKKFGNCMPMSSSQYQLSSAYYYKFQTKWPYEVFSESYEMLLPLLENYVEKQTKKIDGVEVKPGLGGMVAAVYDFISTSNMDIDIEIPEQIIMLDPGLPEKDEVYQRIAVRYQNILNGLNSEVADQIKNATSENTESDNVDQMNVDNEQQSFVEVRSAKRTVEHDYCVPEFKRQKLDKKEHNSAHEQNNVEIGIETEIMSERPKLIELNSCKTSLPNENVLTSEPMVIDCCNESWPHHLLDGESCTNESLEANPVVMPEMQVNSTNGNSLQDYSLIDTAGINNMQSFFDYISNKKDIHSSDSKGFIIRVSELVKNVANWEAMEDIENRIEVQDVRTRQTRIAMLRMREELHDLTFHDSHHAHEYFVVNSFKLFSSLKANKEDKKSLATYKGMELPKVLLPIDIETADKLLEDIKKFAIFPKNPIPYQNFKTEMLENKQFEWNEVNKICKFIKDKREFGATLHELVTNFIYLKNNLADILLFLSEKRIVLRTGIVTVRYVYQQFTNPWIIHSYKILRLEKESHQTIPEGSVYVLDNEESAAEKEKEAKRVTTAANLFYSSPTKSHMNRDIEKDVDNSNEPFKEIVNTSTKEDSSKSENMEMNVNLVNTNEVQINELPQEDNGDDIDGNLKSPKRLRRNRTVLLKQKDIYRAAKLLDFNTAEEIKVVIKPWIRIDGVLNRRVLDRMLGAVLCYCFEKPGTSLANVQNRFTPAIQPYHARELIEILAKLGCVKMSVQKMSKVTLFSKPAKLDMTENPDLIANSDLVFIEPAIQATLKFGMFLSNRSYNLDFLSTL